MSDPGLHLPANFNFYPAIIMKNLRFTVAIFAAVALLGAHRSIAGTLEDAPFRIVAPGAGWQLAAATAQPMGNDVFLVATLSNTNTLLKSVVIKTVLAKASETSLDELCAGMNDSLANPAVKKIAEANTTFLGYKARKFTYLVTQGGQTTYNVAMVFVAGGTGWTIAGVGRSEQKDEIEKTLGFYQKKTG